MADLRRPTRLPPDIAARYDLPGESRGARGAASGPQVTGITVLRYPPEIYPIPDARGFTLFDSADLVGANSTAVPAGLSFQLLPGYTGVVRSVTIDLNDVTATSDVRYAIRIGGAKIPGYDNLRHFPRVAASVAKDFEAFIVVPDGQLIDVLITNIDGGAHKAGAQLVGWSWPTNSGKKWMGEG